MRCKACDKIMMPSEILWRPELKAHEELCKTCRYDMGLDIVSEKELEEEGWKIE
mgnify:FL=1|tara:strand:- start:749 stop:910 length:162 start_codon:yes stop_codon:yes gene_type:complete